jgi:hypothetical protein
VLASLLYVMCGRLTVRAPKANAAAERFVGTIRRECLDWLLVTNHRHLQRVLAEFIDHYNRHRPHPALELSPPEPSADWNKPVSRRDPQTRPARRPHPRVHHRRVNHARSNRCTPPLRQLGR